MQYKIEGTPLPVVICQLDRGECMMTEKGSMSWMTPNMKMETTSNGGIGKALGRMLAGESIFQNRYTAEGGEGMIAFASSFPGTILPVEITPDRPVIVQKSAFLAGVESVDISLFLQKKRFSIHSAQRCAVDFLSPETEDFIKEARIWNKYEFTLLYRFSGKRGGTLGALPQTPAGNKVPCTLSSLRGGFKRLIPLLSHAIAES